VITWRGPDEEVNMLFRRRAVPAFRLPIAFLLVMPPAMAAEAVPGVFDVRSHGAVGDGKADDTAAIAAAVKACADSGGGQVRFPPGRYLSGTVRLASKVTLYLDAGAVLAGTPDLDRYQSFSPPAIAPEAGWSRWHRALILGDGVEDVAIAGSGTIDGNKVFDAKGEERMRGPHTIILGNCRGATIRDVEIRDSANYAVFFQGCDRVEVRGVRITGGWDGVHFRGWPGRPCRDIKILDCQMYTGDDAIAGRYWEDVLIAGCVLNSSCNCVRLIGPAKRLIIHDCLLYGPGLHPHRTSNRTNALAGLNLQPGAWDRTEGALDDVLISDISMHRVATPFHFTLKPGNTAGRIDVRRVTADGVHASSVESWAEEPFGRVTFRDVDLEFEGGGGEEEARIAVRAPGVDVRPLPAWGFYARNVRDLRFEDVRLSWTREDRRPALICDRVASLALDAFRMPRIDGGAAPLGLSGVQAVTVRETDLPLAVVRIVEIRVAGGGGSAVAAGKPFAIAVTIEGGLRDGLARVDLDVAGTKGARWTWARPGERKEVLFEGLIAPAAGRRQVRSGERTAEIEIAP